MIIFKAKEAQSVHFRLIKYTGQLLNFPLGENGGKIIQETFANFGNEEYLEMAYEVARHHHEKWNGKGYPDGLKRKEIPLCARIMAAARCFLILQTRTCLYQRQSVCKI
ncbi:MAG: HD-GYP domain-containing protein [Clostridia bacterium]